MGLPATSALGCKAWIRLQLWLQGFFCTSDVSRKGMTLMVTVPHGIQRSFPTTCLSA